MKLILENNVFDNIHAEYAIVILDEKELQNSPKSALLQRTGFKAAQDELCNLIESSTLYCGVDAYTPDAIRSSLTGAIRTLMKYNVARIKVAALGNENLQAVVEGIMLGGYQFNDYKSEPKELALKEVLIAAVNLQGTLEAYEPMKARFEAAKIIANATNFTRDLVNATPEDIYPAQLAIIAQDLADRNDLTCNILDEHALEAEGMNAMLAVGRASRHKPRLIHLSYQPENPLKTVVLVGKGLTYDAGGMSLKPATAMVTMKMDKSGACGVLGMLKAISELGLPLEVHGFIGAAENMIDSNAYKPDDVLRSKSGKTIEVRNTDAEGRLVLCDVLTYAQQHVKPDYLFDYATLTGACLMALGQYTTGVMGNSNLLKRAFMDVADTSGENTGTLPFNSHLRKLLKSEIADISNTSSKPYGGAITAALFLDHFIEDENKEKWLHFDIAGSAYTETPWDCNGYGATGAGVRMTLKFLQHLSHEGN
jgi:leucyl aminopeptidase